GRQRAAEDGDQLRRVDLGVLCLAVYGGSSGAGASWWPAGPGVSGGGDGSPAGDGAAGGAVAAAGVPERVGGFRLPQPALADLRRRVVGGRPGGGLPVAFAGPSGQRLRPDGELDHGEPVDLRRGGGGCGSGDDRSSDRQRRALRAGPEP